MTKGEKTKEKLRRAALELFVEQGVAETSTRQIAERAGVAEGTIYRHFPSKEELASELLADINNRLYQAAAEARERADGVREGLAGCVRAYCQQADLDWLLFSYHLRYQHAIQDKNGKLIGNPLDVVRALIQEGMAEGQLPARDLELVMSMALGVVLQAATHKVYGNLSAPLGDYAELLAQGVWAVLTLPLENGDRSSSTASAAVS